MRRVVIRVHQLWKNVNETLAVTECQVAINTLFQRPVESFNDERFDRFVLGAKVFGSAVASHSPYIGVVKLFSFVRLH